MNPSYCIRNTGNSQNIFRATLIPFGATHVEFRTSQSEVRKKMFYVFLNLKTKSVDYHMTKCTLLLCVNFNTLQNRFCWTSMLHKNLKEIFVAIIFKSKGDL